MVKKKFTTSTGVYKMSKKAVWITCGTILVTLCILMTIAAFYDYQIDYILAKPYLPDPKDDATVGAGLGFVYTSNVFGKIVEIIGTGPCIICTIISLIIFHQNAYKIKSRGLKLTVQISSIAVGIMWSVYSCFFQFFPLMVVSIIGVQEYSKIAPLASTGFINPNGTQTAILYLVFGIVFSAFLIVPSWLILRRVEKQTMNELLRYAFILTSASIIAILLVEIALKPSLQRERFRFLMAYENVDPNNINNVPIWDSYHFEFNDTWYYLPDPRGEWINNAYGRTNYDPNGGFHPWYALPYTPYLYGSKGNLPFISEDSSKSFPSGHETMAAVGFYSLVVLPFTVKRFNTRKWRWILFTTAVTGSGVVALARLVAGAHYLSDVTIGSLIAIGLLCLFYLQYVYGSKHLDSWCNLKIVRRK